MIQRIIFAPMPPMFMRERPSLRVPRGIIMPNMRSMSVFLTRTRLGLRRMLSPQNVKKIVTLRPIAAAPFAMMNTAMVLSRSPLNTTKVLSWRTSPPSGLKPVCCGAAAGVSADTDRPAGDDGHAAAGAPGAGMCAVLSMTT